MPKYESKERYPLATCCSVVIIQALMMPPHVEFLLMHRIVEWKMQRGILIYETSSNGDDFLSSKRSFKLPHFRLLYERSASIIEHYKLYHIVSQALTCKIK